MEHLIGKSQVRNIKSSTINFIDDYQEKYWNLNGMRESLNEFLSKETEKFKNQFSYENLNGKQSFYHSFRHFGCIDFLNLNPFSHLDTEDISDFSTWFLMNKSVLLELLNRYQRSYSGKPLPNSQVLENFFSDRGKYIIMIRQPEGSTDFLWNTITGMYVIKVN